MLNIFFLFVFFRVFPAFLQFMVNKNYEFVFAALA